MRFLNFLILLLVSVNVFGQGIIPQPEFVSRNVPYSLINLKSQRLTIVEDVDLSAFLGQYLEKTILNRFGKHSDLSKKEYPITLELNNNFKNKETYSMDITPQGITISGSEKGIFYGIQSLQQLVFHSSEQLECQTIVDHPKFAWRGMHLDVSRHFFSVDFIKKYIDVLALHKMNTFHWHLTDDQGWRIEIKKYPKLTQIGSQRKETIVAKNFDPYKGDGKPYGGFYTQEDIKEVVAYAKERYITIVPEIEMPGHAVAALSAYPQFSCRQQPLKTLTKWGISDDVYCSKDSTFEFIFDIMNEVLELFPSKYIHIGGDEAPKTRWKKCTHCQANIKKHHLKDEHELQSYFIGRIDSFLTSKGRKTIGWDEILEGGLAENAAVMSWRGVKGGIAAASQKHNVVMSPGSHCYFDHYQGNKKTEPLAIGGYTPLKKVYSYNPIPKDLKEEYAQYVLGAQGNVWTEYMETPEHVMYMALPRLCALSEVLWTGKKNSDYEDFKNRLVSHFNLLDSMDINYSQALFDISAVQIFSKGKMKVQLSSEFDGFNEIRYTTDGSKPNVNSSLYTKPLELNKTTLLRAVSLSNGEQVGHSFSQEYKVHQATGKKIKLKNPPSSHYNTGGAQTLINGIVGSLPWSGNEWLGWKGKPMEVTIDLGKKIKVRKIKVSFLEAPESWIHYPMKVVRIDPLQSSNYFKVFETPLIYKNGFYEIESKMNIGTRYVTIKAIPLDVIPEGNPGSGQTPWLFCSEIIIE